MNITKMIFLNETINIFFSRKIRDLIRYFMIIYINMILNNYNNAMMMCSLFLAYHIDAIICKFVLSEILSVFCYEVRSMKHYKFLLLCT